MHAKTIALLLWLLSITVTPCQAENTDWNNPLQPAETGSPRDTLKSFIATLNESHARLMAVLTEYLASPGLYTTDEQEVAVDYALTKVQLAKRTLDLSGIPAALAEQIAAYRILQLKEILDRLDLPPMDSVPTRQRWPTRSSRAGPYRARKSPSPASIRRPARRRVPVHPGNGRQAAEFL